LKLPEVAELDIEPLLKISLSLRSSTTYSISLSILQC